MRDLEQLLNELVDNLAGLVTQKVSVEVARVAAPQVVRIVNEKVRDLIETALIPAHNQLEDLESRLRALESREKP